MTERCVLSVIGVTVRELELQTFVAAKCSFKQMYAATNLKKKKVVDFSFCFCSCKTANFVVT